VNKLSDNSQDKKYFTITPRLVHALSRDPYDYTLWCTIKDIAGEHGECILSTEDLAALAMMSAGKASQSRKHLLGIGLLTGEIRRDIGYPQPVWHLSVPDLWEENVAWANDHPTLQDRIAWKKYHKEAAKHVNIACKKSLHHMKASPHEGSVEKEPSPGETKKKEEPFKDDDDRASPNFGDVVKAYESLSGTINGFIADELKAACDEWDQHRAKLSDNHPDKNRGIFEVVILAVQHMGKHTNTPNLTYLDRILENWKQNGVMAQKPKKKTRDNSQPPKEEPDWESIRAEKKRLAKERWDAAGEKPT